MADVLPHADRLLVWLADHPRSTINDVAAHFGWTRERAMLELRVLEQDGRVFHEPPPPPTTRKYPRHWSVTR